jgi:hypothetical protein
MKKTTKIVLPKPNTNVNIDTFFSSRLIHFDDEKKGILNIVKIKRDYIDLPSTDKVKTKTSSGKVKTKTSSGKVKTKTSSGKVKTKTSSGNAKTKTSSGNAKTKTSSGKVKTKSQRYY